MRSLVVAPSGTEEFWPVRSRWRAMIVVRGEQRSPEWMLGQVKAVPLASRIERALLESARQDDGRAILERASEPGEHRVAAAVIAALRLAEDYPDRSLRFLSWISQAPNDPADLRFLRRYLPGLHVLVRLDPGVGLAVPLGRDALALLASELLRAGDDPMRADQVLAALTPSAPVAVARCGLRLVAGDPAGVHALAENRPVTDELTALLRLQDAEARIIEGEPEAALAQINRLVEEHPLTGPVDRAARLVRAKALRATGRHTEADLLDDDFGAAAAADVGTEDVSLPREPPLFGRSLADAMDDAWARVRRQEVAGPVDPNPDRAEVEARCEAAVELFRAGHLESAEAALLAAMDQADAWVDAGGHVVEDAFVLLAGMFDSQQLTVEEVATLERLRAAHQRAGTELSAEVADRLLEARRTLERHQ